MFYQRFECWIILYFTVLQLQRYEQYHQFHQSRTRIGKFVRWTCDYVAQQYFYIFTLPSDFVYKSIQHFCNIDEHLCNIYLKVIIIPVIVIFLIMGTVFTRFYLWCCRSGILDYYWIRQLPCSLNYLVSSLA